MQTGGAQLWSALWDCGGWTRMLLHEPFQARRSLHATPRPTVWERKKYITSFPFRQTDDYKAYEKFSLTMGIFTIGEDWLNFQIHQYGLSLSTFLLYIFLLVMSQSIKLSAPWLWSFLVHPRVKTSLRDICGSPSMTMGQCNVLVKWVKWWIYMD